MFIAGIDAQNTFTGLGVPCPPEYRRKIHEALSAPGSIAAQLHQDGFLFVPGPEPEPGVGHTLAWLEERTNKRVSHDDSIAYHAMYACKDAVRPRWYVLPEDSTALPADSLWKDHDLEMAADEHLLNAAELAWFLLASQGSTHTPYAKDVWFWTASTYNEWRLIVSADHAGVHVRAADPSEDTACLAIAKLLPICL